MIENTSNRGSFSHFAGAFVEGPNGYIAGMEADGGRQLVQSDLLPTSMTPADESEWTALGFTFGAVVDNDPLFRHATLPKGWARKSADDPRGSAIVDERGIDRVSIFYKAAFSDRRADMHIVNVGWQVANHAIYGDGEPTIPWDTLTAAERARAVKAIDRYLDDAERHPSIYGDRAPRAQALRKAAR